jgi:hypothetical protein
MVSKKRRLRVNMNLNEADNAASIAFRAAEYKPDIK